MDSLRPIGMYFEYVCLDCGWIYRERDGLPEAGIAPGTFWSELPEDFKCPECETRKSDTHMWQKLDV